MIRSLYILFFVLIQAAGFSQNTQIDISKETKTLDSLRLQLVQAKTDSARIGIMENIGFIYETLDVDSSLKYSEAALALARRKGYAWAESRMLASLSGVMRQQGKFAEALDLLFNALKIAEKNNITNQIARCNRRLGLVYFDLENFPKALAYYQKALKVDEVLPDNESIIAIDHMILGNAFEKMNKLDSALLHSEKAFEQKRFISGGYQQIYWTLGNIELKKANYEQAKVFLTDGLGERHKNKNHRTAGE